jgi:hypothetical protein
MPPPCWRDCTGAAGAGAAANTCSHKHEQQEHTPARSYEPIHYEVRSVRELLLHDRAVGGHTSRGDMELERTLNANFAQKTAPRAVVRA